MNRLMIIPAAIAFAIASPSNATSLMFGGTFNNTNAPASTMGRCANLTVTIGNSGSFYATGKSNLGAFTSSQSHCLDSGPPIMVGAPNTPYYDGLFTYSFASGATLTGTYDGLLSNSGVMGVIDNTQNFIITGGTGTFANATGSFLGTGQILFGAGLPTANLTISQGVIDVAAVPELTTWAMFLVGFGVIGAGLRGRRSIKQTNLVPMGSAYR